MQSFYKEKLTNRLLGADDHVLNAMDLVCDTDPVFDALKAARKVIAAELNKLNEVRFQ